MCKNRYGCCPINRKPHPLIQQCILQLQEYFEGKRKTFDLPLQQKGSAFQQNVWAQLLNISYGKTISYLELSKRVGDVKAIRAVGTANGKNQLAIIIPCHRVIGSDGSLTGYAGELWRKKWLLEHEGKFANGVQTLF
ncbi:MAG: methylated-DNA--[protein]-cysteine S-methyltransferase [Chitinophagaceae bacterium]|nr:methylated-DNA--[protein]-cysteine S-methyltransferase [Chitinophagaceae bacterium]